MSEAGTLTWNGSQADRQFEQVEVENVSVHGFGLRSTRYLPVGQTVWFESNSVPVVKGVVRHCEERDGYFQIGLIRVETEHRRVERQPVRGAGNLDWYGDGAKACSTPVLVRDASEFGLQLSAVDPVPVGRIVRLTGDALECVATVCYCVRIENEYRLGLHFTRQPYDKHSAEFDG
jgi:hypothetical protein